jgi:glutamine cyclotransferase
VTLRVLCLLLVSLASWLITFENPTTPPVPSYSFVVLHAYPHDPHAFTQGFEYRNGFLYEGTGLKGHSTLRKEELETGKVLEEVKLPDRYFGEGVTVLNDKVMQLTWQSHIGFVYAEAGFRFLNTFSYQGEGWGLTNNGSEIYMSDGTPQIRCLDPNTLHEIRRITVNEEGTPIQNLNELEWVRGELYANVWLTDRVAQISPQDGSVVGWIDLSHLLSAAEGENADVLNGIAYDAEGDRLFVTGKLWPKVFQIRVVPKK